MTTQIIDTPFATEWELLDPVLDFRQMMSHEFHQMMSFESAELALIPPPCALHAAPLNAVGEVHS